MKMCENQQKEIALWLNGDYKGGTGTSSIYILSRCLGMNNDNIRIPHDNYDLTRCFELVKNCSFIQQNIKETIFNDKIFKVYPVYRELFNTLFIKYCNHTQNEFLLNSEVDSILNPSIDTMLMYVKQHTNIFKIEDNKLFYDIDGIRCSYKSGYYKEQSIKELEEIEIKNKMDMDKLPEFERWLQEYIIPNSFKGFDYFKYEDFKTIFSYNFNLYNTFYRNNNNTEYIKIMDFLNAIVRENNFVMLRNSEKNHI